MAVGLGFGQANEGKIFCDEVHDLPFVLNKFLPFTPLSTYIAGGSLWKLGTF